MDSGGCGSSRAMDTQVLVFDSTCRGAIWAHVFEPQPGLHAFAGQIPNWRHFLLGGTDMSEVQQGT